MTLKLTFCLKKMFQPNTTLYFAIFKGAIFTLVKHGESILQHLKNKLD